MFDEYYKKLKDLEQNVPEIFKKVAKKGAIKFVNEAKKRTDKEKLVDTGNYRRNWNAEVIEPLPETYGVQCENNAEYASFLEFGHRTRAGNKVKGKFVGELAMGDARFYCLEQLEDALDKAYKQK